MAASVRAAELVGRRLGMVSVERKDITISPGAKPPLRSYSFEELEAMREEVRSIEVEEYQVVQDAGKIPVRALGAARAVRLL